MKSFVAHETGDGGLADLLRDYDYVPVVELVGDVFDRVFRAELVRLELIVFIHKSHIFLVEPDVNLSQPVH